MALKLSWNRTASCVRCVTKAGFKSSYLCCKLDTESPKTPSVDALSFLR